MLDYYTVINISLSKLETILEKKIYKQNDYLENDLFIMQFISQNELANFAEKSVEKIFFNKHIVSARFDKKIDLFLERKDK